MSKRRKSNAKSQSNTLKYIAWILAFVAFALLASAGSYYVGFQNAKEELTKKEEEKKQRRLELLKRIEETNVPVADSVNDRLKKVLQENKFDGGQEVSIQLEGNVMKVPFLVRYDDAVEAQIKKLLHL